MALSSNERSFLFVPGDRPERYLKALDTPADRVIIDLEDAVLPDAKAQARETLARWLAGPDARDIAVRINSAGSDWHEADLALVAGNPRVVGVMLPKADRKADIEAVAARLAPHQSLIALVETIRGYLDLRQFAGARGLARLAFGSVDFCAETGIRGLGMELDAVRTELVIVSRAHGLAPPVEGVTIAVKDAELLGIDIDRARRFGFGGKLCIHPSQVEAVNTGFSATPQEIDWAHRVIAAAAQGGAVTVDGKLVDKPVVDLAEKLLASVRAS
jgi:citrate lyase subunit beta/citryl-CoA lyase